jgi:hypothetical protein
MKTTVIILVIAALIGIAIIFSFVLRQPAVRREAGELRRDIEHGAQGVYDAGKGAVEKAGDKLHDAAK